MGRTKVQMQARPASGDPGVTTSAGEQATAQTREGEAASALPKEEPVNSQPGTSAEQDAKVEAQASGEVHAERSASAPPGDPPSQPPEDTLAVPSRSEGGLTAGAGDQGSGANGKEGGGSRSASAPGSETEGSETHSDDGAGADFHKEQFMKLGEPEPPADVGGIGEAGDIMPVGPSVARSAPYFEPPPANEKFENRKWRQHFNLGLLKDVMQKAKRRIGTKTGPFLTQVDIAYVPDYLDFVAPENEMWLHHISNKMRALAYSTIDQFLADFRLMVTNCEAYNSPGNGKFGGPVLMEWSRELLETCTKVVNENRAALTEAEQAIQDPNCPPCDDTPPVEKRRASKPLDKPILPLPPGFQHTVKVTTGKPEGYVQYVITCPQHGEKLADRIRIISDFFNMHAHCRDEWNCFARNLGEVQEDYLERLRETFCFKKDIPPNGTSIRIQGIEKAKPAPVSGGPPANLSSMTSILEAQRRQRLASDPTYAGGKRKQREDSEEEDDDAPSVSGGSSRGGKRHAQLPTAVWRPNTSGAAKPSADPASANFYPISSAAPSASNRQMLWPANIAGGTQYPEPEGLLPTQQRGGQPGRSGAAVANGSKPPPVAFSPVKNPSPDMLRARAGVVSAGRTASSVLAAAFTDASLPLSSSQDGVGAQRLADALKELTDAKNEAQREVKNLTRELELKEKELQHTVKQLEFEKERTAFAESKYTTAMETNKDLRAQLAKSSGDG